MKWVVERESAAVGHGGHAADGTRAIPGARADSLITPEQRAAVVVEGFFWTGGGDQSLKGVLLQIKEGPPTGRVGWWAGGQDSVTEK